MLTPYHMLFLAAPNVMMIGTEPAKTLAMKLQVILHSLASGSLFRSLAQPDDEAKGG